MHKLKQFGRMVVDSDADLTFDFYADGILTWSHTLKHNGVDHRREFISPLVEGRRIQVRIKSFGTLRGVSYEFILRRL